MICNLSFSTVSLSCDTMSEGNNQLSQYTNLSDNDRFMYKVKVKTISEITALTSSEVVHQNDSDRFVLWDRQCAGIFGISACMLKNQMLAEGEDDSNAFPLILDMILRGQWH
ncbi:hypothetical protein Lal_00022390 [Lupinus albus]|nr:hypothetical protein Lal_00022390 [Lupinus albus]